MSPILPHRPSHSSGLKSQAYTHPQLPSISALWPFYALSSSATLHARTELEYRRCVMKKCGQT